MKILLLGLASSIHSEEYYTERYLKVIELFKKATNLKIDYLDKPLINYINLSSEYDLYIVVYLTGGTSNLGFKLISNIGKPVLIIASGEHNALASALSTRSKLNKLGVKNYLLTYIDLSDLENRVEIIAKSIEIINELKNLRILEINENGIVSNNGINYIEKIGGYVEAISYSDLMKKTSVLSSNDLIDLINNLKKKYNIVENQWIVEIAKIIYIVEEIVREKSINVVSIDCFPLIIKTGYTPCLLVSYLNSRGIPVICENDYYSLPLMYIAYRLTGLPGWISNPSGYTKDGYLRFAHCTIADNLCFNCEAVDHFETGKPYGLTCKFKYRDVIFARLNNEYSVLKIYRGRVIDSGLISDKYCRTQLIVETPGLKPTSFYREALGNHHVFIINENSFIEYLEIISWWMNWKIELGN